MTELKRALTSDKFLNGALEILQPKTGYRAATDPVFLAASVSIKPGQSILELGCGIGVAALCLAHRIPGIAITGLEVQAFYAELARKNAIKNGIDLTIYEGAVENIPKDLRQHSFDHVMFNPPFFKNTEGTAPVDSEKSIAHMTNLTISDWISAGIKRLKPMGYLTFIHHAGVLSEALRCLHGQAGDICIKPLTARPGMPAKRIILRCRKGAQGPLTLLSPLIIHPAQHHHEDEGAFTIEADQILRYGSALRM